MANTTKSTAFFAFNASFKIPVTPEIYDVIEESDTLKKVEDNGNLYIQYVYTAEANINKLSLQVRKEFVGIGGGAGQAPKKAIDTVEKLMMATDQQTIEVTVSDAIFQLYKHKDANPSDEVNDRNLLAISSITGKTIDVPTTTKAKVNLKGLL